MAQRTIVTLVDDLTGEEAENISTVEFALDGMTYELDLTDENSAKLREALSPYAGAGRKIGGRRRSGSRPDRAIRSNGSGAGYNRETLKSIREWAKKNGHSVSDRGRLSAEVRQAWQTAQAGMSRA
jgi:nucleoid-associated protein Lsr2